MNEDSSERARVTYERNFEQARSLNGQMNQVPALAMTLTGGLWFAAAMTEDLAMEIRFALLVFAGLCNLSLVFAILRIRDVFESYLEQLKAYYPQGFASGYPKNPKVPWLGSYSMIIIYCALMLIGACFSFVAAFWKYWPFAFPAWVGVVVLSLGLLGAYVLARCAAPSRPAGV